MNRPQSGGPGPAVPARARPPCPLPLSNGPGWVSESLQHTVAPRRPPSGVPQWLLRRTSTRQPRAAGDVPPRAR